MRPTEDNWMVPYRLYDRMVLKESRDISDILADHVFNLEEDQVVYRLRNKFETYISEVGNGFPYLESIRNTVGYKRAIRRGRLGMATFGFFLGGFYELIDGEASLENWMVLGSVGVALFLGIELCTKVGAYANGLVRPKKIKGTKAWARKHRKKAEKFFNFQNGTNKDEFDYISENGDDPYSEDNVYN